MGSETMSGPPGEFTGEVLAQHLGFVSRPGLKKLVEKSPSKIACYIRAVRVTSRVKVKEF